MKKPPFLFVCCLLLLLCALGTGWSASSRGMSIEKTDISLRVDGDNGHLEVCETYIVNFISPHHGIYRSIPLVFKDPVTGKSRMLKIEDLSVAFCGKEAAHPLKASTYGERFLGIRIGDPHRTITGRHCYQLAYKVIGYTFVERNAQGLFWNAVGTGWNIPLHNVLVRLSLPQGIKVTNRACYQGRYQSLTPCYLFDTDSSGTMEAQVRILPPHHALSLKVSWTPPIIPDKIIEDPLPGEAGNLIFILVGLLAVSGVFFILSWYFYGRDPSVERSDMVLYEPPKDLSPLEAGVLVDERLDGKDIAATIVNLARKGFLKIREKHKLLGKDYEIQIVKPASEVDDPYEEIVMRYLLMCSQTKGVMDSLTLGLILSMIKGKDLSEAFDRVRTESGVSTVTTSDLRKTRYGLKLYKALSKRIYKDLTTRGYFPKSPFKTRKYLQMAVHTLLFLTVLTVFFLVLFQGTFSPEIFQLLSFRIYGAPLFMGVVISLIIFNVMALLWVNAMPRKTGQGALLAWKLRGFKEFVKRVEVDRLERLYGKDQLAAIFEEYLPITMVLGVAKEWGRLFDSALTSPPSWYHGYSGFSASSFSHSMASSFASSTGTSSSGGGSGSGGGGGGGGGGGW